VPFDSLNNPAETVISFSYAVSLIDETVQEMLREKERETHLAILESTVKSIQVTSKL